MLFCQSVAGFVAGAFCLQTIRGAFMGGKTKGGRSGGQQNGGRRSHCFLVSNQLRVRPAHVVGMLVDVDNGFSRCSISDAVERQRTPRQQHTRAGQKSPAGQGRTICFISHFYLEVLLFSVSPARLATSRTPDKMVVSMDECQGAGWP